MRWPIRRNRLGSVSERSRCTFHAHDSREERAYCQKLQLLQKAGEIIGFDTQVTYRLNVNGKHICSHRVDFLVKTSDGRTEVHEYKGVETSEWRIKRKLFEAVFPEIPYLVKRKGDLL